MQLRIYFNVVFQVLAWFLPCTWFRWVIWQCFQRVKWWRIWRGNRKIDILLFRMNTLLFLHVFHCSFADCWSSGTCCSLFIWASISDFFFHDSASSCDFLISLSSLQDSSWHWRYSSLSLVLLIASLWRNMSSNPWLDLFILQKSSEACGCLFFFRVRSKSQFTIGLFSNNPLLKNHSNKEHDNAKKSLSKSWYYWRTCWK